MSGDSPSRWKAGIALMLVVCVKTLTCASIFRKSAEVGVTLTDGISSFLLRPWPVIYTVLLSTSRLHQNLTVTPTWGSAVHTQEGQALLSVSND